MLTEGYAGFPRCIKTAATSQQELLVDDVSCASCVAKIEVALKQLPGVDTVQMHRGELHVV